MTKTVTLAEVHRLPREIDSRKSTRNEHLPPTNIFSQNRRVRIPPEAIKATENGRRSPHSLDTYLLYMQLLCTHRRIKEAEENVRVLRRLENHLTYEVQVRLSGQIFEDDGYIRISRANRNVPGKNVRLPDASDVIHSNPSKDTVPSKSEVIGTKCYQTNVDKRAKKARRRLVYNPLLIILLVCIPLMSIGFILHVYLNKPDFIGNVRSLLGMIAHNLFIT